MNPVAERNNDDTYTPPRLVRVERPWALFYKGTDFDDVARGILDNGMYPTLGMGELVTVAFDCNHLVNEHIQEGMCLGSFKQKIRDFKGNVYEQTV